MFNHKIKDGTQCKECGLFYAAVQCTMGSSGAAKWNDAAASGVVAISSPIVERYKAYEAAGKIEMCQLLEEFHPGVSGKAKPPPGKAASPYQSMQAAHQALMAAHKSLDQGLDRVAAIAVSLQEAKAAAAKHMAKTQAAENTYDEAKKVYDAHTGANNGCGGGAAPAPVLTLQAAIEKEAANTDQLDTVAVQLLQQQFQLAEQLRLHNAARTAANAVPATPPDNKRIKVMSGNGGVEAVTAPGAIAENAPLHHKMDMGGDLDESMVHVDVASASVGNVSKTFVQVVTGMSAPAASSQAVNATAVGANAAAEEKVFKLRQARESAIADAKVMAAEIKESAHL